MITAPVLVEVERSGLVESAHRGHVVIVDGRGEVVFAAGDPDVVCYPRSAVKPLQAAGMLDAGLQIDGSWLALACASHSGEPFHLAAVEAMLAHVGLGTDALRCPPDWPYAPAAQRAYAAAGHTAQPVAMNCSGKHAAMLMTCVANDWSLADYLDPQHPLQMRLRSTVDLATGGILATSTDGCGAPLWAVRLSGLARAFMDLPPAVAAAMQAYPEYVGGTTRDVTALMRSVPALVTKDGAEAVQVMAVEVAGQRFGVALKVVDGADRARSVIAAGALRWLGLGSPVIDDLLNRPVLGGGRPVGRLTLADGAFL